MDSCRNAIPGILKLYIGNYGDILSYEIDSTDAFVTGLTMSGGTKFYPVLLTRSNASFINDHYSNISYGTSVARPKVSFKTHGLNTTTMKMYNELKACDTAIVVKLYSGSLLAVGLQNGMAMSNGFIGTDASEFIGAYFELEGIETKPFYFLDPNLDFENEYTVACITGDIDGGTACTLVFENTLDGGGACTTRFHCNIDGETACS